MASEDPAGRGGRRDPHGDAGSRDHGADSISECRSTGTRRDRHAEPECFAGSARNAHERGNDGRDRDGYAAEVSWPDSVAAEFGMRVHNMAQGGMGYQTAPRWCDVAPCASIRGSVTKIVASAPSLVVLAAGEADGDQELAESATATLDQLREALPTATIVVMSPTTDRATTPAWLERHAEQLKEAASESGATWLDVTPITSGSAASEAGSLTPPANGQVAAALERALR